MKKNSLKADVLPFPASYFVVDFATWKATTTDPVYTFSDNHMHEKLPKLGRGWQLQSNWPETVDSDPETVNFMKKKHVFFEKPL